MKKIIILSCLVVSAVYAFAQTDSATVDLLSESNVPMDRIEAASSIPTKGEADSAYIRGDFASAIAIYEDILANQGESADIYYNLGNSYYKGNNIAKALLNLERAALLKPGDSDINFNLELVRSKTVDKVSPMNEMFLISWFHSIKNCMGVDGWTSLAVVLFIVFVVSLALYIFGKKLVLKKTSFFVALFALIFVVLANVFAYSQKKSLTDRKNAIIMVPSITVKSTPNESGTDLFILHEGHKVAIRDASMKEWVEIKLEDGNIGWIPVSVIEII